MKHYDYLILGNSAAAISAIEAIRARDVQGTIACVSPETDDAYSTPMISYLLKGTTTQNRMSIRPNGFYRHYDVDCLFGQAAVALDSQKKTVELADGKKIGYGKVLIATGSVPSDAPVAGLEGENVFNFLNLTDARAVMDCIARRRAANPDSPVHAVVIGSGLIGTKAAEGLSALADSVTMLARSGSVLRSILDAQASPLVERVFADHGVRIRLNTVATKALTEDGEVTSLELSSGEVIAADVVIAASGVKPNIALATAAGAKVERGIVCDRHMRTSIHDVYAAGDVAQSHDILDGADKIIALWPDAVAQGRVAGDAMAGGDRTYDGGFALNAIGFFDDVHILSSGLSRAGEACQERMLFADDMFSKFIMKDDRLLGFVVVNRPECAGIYTSLIRDAVPLSSVDPMIFERAPQMDDLPREVRWKAMHQGYAKEMV